MPNGALPVPFRRIEIFEHVGKELRDFDLIHAQEAIHEMVIATHHYYVALTLDH